MMFNRFSGVFCIAFFAATGACADERWQCPPFTASQVSPIAPNGASIERGKQLVMANGCVDCHGGTGLGDGVAAARIVPHPANWHANEVQEQSDGCLLWKLQTGRPPMPATADLSDQERWQIIRFIRSLVAR